MSVFVKRRKGTEKRKRMIVRIILSFVYLRHEKRKYLPAFRGQGAPIRPVSSAGAPAFVLRTLLHSFGEWRVCVGKSAVLFPFGVFLLYKTVYESYLPAGGDVRHSLYRADRCVCRPCAWGIARTDSERISMLMACIRSEYLSPSSDTSRIAACWINSILLICVRNLRHLLGDAPHPVAESDKLMSMLQYIELHLDNPELLTAKTLSQRFNTAETYIGKFFKARTGESLKRYILKCRIKVVEELLNYTDLRINEIVARTGFVDESHLTHTFKRITGVTPLEYKKKINQNIR